MTTFGKQLVTRQRRDRRDVSESLANAAEAAQGRIRYHEQMAADEAQQAEVQKICRFYQVPYPEEIPAAQNLSDMVEYITRPSGIPHRLIRLEGTWWRSGGVALLAIRKDNDMPVALLPLPLGGYYYLDTGNQRVKINRKNKDMFVPEATCFYKPLPQESMDAKQLFRLILRQITWTDIAWILLATLLITVIGLMTPMVTRILFSRIIPTGEKLLAISMAIMLLSTAVAAYMINIVRNELMDRIGDRMEIFSIHALMSRVLNLPVDFFTGKTAGALASSIMQVKELAGIITGSILAPGITVVFSIAYVIQIASIGHYLALPAFITFLVQVAIIVISVYQRVKISSQELEAQTKIQAMAYESLNGIQRIRLSGSEKRVFSRWVNEYRHKAYAAFPTVFPCSFMTEMVVAASLLGTLWVYGVGVRDGMDVGQFAAFLSAYGMVIGGLTSFSTTGKELARIRPILKLAEPILKECPETESDRIVVTQLQGDIEMSHVSFRYEEDEPWILQDMNLKIHEGEYVGIVGKSGCGKSTLIRILMGFETPQEGTVFYDGNDIKTIDPVSLRQKMGTVLQNGQLYNGDIFTNITISAPWLTMKDAWEAAEIAGLADTIREMPLGMHTVIEEGSGGFSGGQKQRLMIARAVAARPRILLFDEATSALDNVTQKTVSDYLDQLHCTRVVIAHRLSTIQNCDRIMVMDQGKIIENGTYDDLIAEKGLFAELVSRQQL